LQWLRRAKAVAAFAHKNHRDDGKAKILTVTVTAKLVGLENLTSLQLIG